MNDETKLVLYIGVIYSLTETEQQCKPLFHYLMFSMRHVKATPSNWKTIRLVGLQWCT